MSVGIGPRLAWMRVSRAAFVTGRLSGFGAGGAFGVSGPIGSRLAIETGAAATFISFGAADFPGMSDPDSQAYGMVYAIRFGVKYRLK